MILQIKGQTTAKTPFSNMRTLCKQNIESKLEYNFDFRSSHAKVFFKNRCSAKSFNNEVIYGQNQIWSRPHVTDGEHFL